MTWYSMKMKAPKKARVDIYDVIAKDWYGDGTVVEGKKFVNDLKALGELDEIELHINSPGGAVFEGNVIYNELRRHKAKVTAIVDGLAASIASVIAMAADKIIMPSNAMMMIHDPSGLAWGNAQEMQKMIERLEKIKEGAVTAYEGKTGLSRDEISEMMTEETWLTADEAVEKGFADEVEGAVQMAACFDIKGKFKNAPTQFFPKNLAFVENESAHLDLKLKSSTSDPSGDFTVLTLETLKADHPEIYNQVVTDGATQERQRIQAVMKQSMPGHEELLNKLAFDGKTTGPEAAVEVLSAHKANLGKAHTEFVNQAPKPVPQEPKDETVEMEDTDKVKLPDNFDALTLEEQCKVRWSNDPDIRNEYKNLEAYTLAEKYSGSTRVLKK